MSAPIRRRGYTLIELVVTILIIGVLTSIAVPQYLNTVEAGYADDAASTVNMIGTTNKMFALDHNNYYAQGTFPAASGGTGNCQTYTSGCTVIANGACPTAAVAAATPVCALVCCKYLADQDWGDKKYAFSACDATLGGGGGAGAGGGVTACAAGDVAAAKRATSATANYTGWGYTMLTTGQITALGTTPPASF